MKWFIELQDFYPWIADFHVEVASVFFPVPHRCAPAGELLHDRGEANCEDLKRFPHKYMVVNMFVNSCLIRMCCVFFWNFCLMILMIDFWRFVLPARVSVSCLTTRDYVQSRCADAAALNCRIALVAFLLSWWRLKTCHCLLMLSFHLRLNNCNELVEQKMDIFRSTKSLYKL